MCGIVGYVGHRKAFPIIIEGLKRLEYRGYDSAGIALYDGTDLNVSKTKGKVADLVQKVNNEISTSGSIGIGHTRWATHGVPNDVNAHPHYSNSGDLVIIHNGIIENYESLKKELTKRGYTFKSDTDTEVLINLIEDVKLKENVKLGKAVQVALNQVVGAYAIAVFDKNKPDEIVIARLGSPLAVGVGENEFFIASDASPFIEYTKNAIYLEDEEMAIIRANKGIKIRKIKDDSLVDPYVQELQMNLEQIEKGGYDHFMLKEIYEQPTAIKDTYRGRLLVKEGIIRMAGIDDNIEKFLNANRIIIVACGTSWHAGLVAEYIFEDIARIPVEVEYASEFRYRNPVITNKDVVIAISQSGETADTLAAIKLAKANGAFVFGVCNVVGSSIARETHAGAYTHAGPEIGVASTKAFTTQITLLTLIALKLAKVKGEISNSDYRYHLQELELIPEKVESALKSEEHIKMIAEKYKNARNFLYLGRGYNFPVALEGALKLKEISYIHAEGYPAAEMKHGPIALIDENMPVVVIATKKGHYEKVVSNIEEIKARQGKIIGVVTEGDVNVKKLADYVIEVPESLESLSPLLTTIPLQLLSYHIAVMLDRNVDQPRNLAKSVTVE
ncbi:MULTISPECIES: glutamine--fructose-6-phosphate transaminase (isomerizing) [Xanthomarina]|jgi:glucosamine--fructose-6-phosphate aminotransferase (isomerizing)|uniref:glutamine--fructose-6-phosphate transaminase (isomerizing) n=1 Tax=Xanthomarina TaxID=1868329 RepID=UPI000C5CB3A5|nr:glutamine--fructose-6-phosphate transaminase (isomerizing) [Xanthomarina sp.]MAL22312.1 glutamine--fructose-6-phosphate transaminase (isomerizing) [Xanthomarina sp.]MBF60850.1 glutamine--fructose-6-phosphate transaminase (isomerizing) [Xanthomarina sp.]MCB0388362.1 glutamine--fructose-6-phosphate transaminase (isomerizing) [Winogradskyella sp.]HAB28817.1 glutamine--fructose-6-phosphate transaminase (isomerizing) [Xanthomarina gelatinilytica]|tara:strand:+ start:3311 stop:5158 length:1848 start_codon:yes stop_codon:yes gene_type:complete